MNSSEKKNKICVVIPIFNEVDFLDELLSKIPSVVSKIICVDDGSTDGSHELLEANINVELLTNSKNFGKGFALRVGLEHALKSECEYIVTLDGDLQHNPAMINDFIEMLEQYDVVIGNRLHNLKEMPVQRIISNKLTSWLLSLKTGHKVLDSQSGFRAFKKNVLKDAIPVETGFEAETEMIIRILQRNYTIGYFNIPTIYNNNTSKMKPVAAIAGFLKVLLRKY